MKNNKNEREMKQSTRSATSQPAQVTILSKQSRRNCAYQTCLLIGEYSLTKYFGFLLYCFQLK